MKIITLPDLHIRTTKPKNRLDEDFYNDVIIKKLVFIQNYAVDNMVDFVVSPGDFFDHHNISKKVISDVLNIIHPSNHEFSKVKWFAVYGQHDLVNHSPNVENTPLNILASSGAVKILGYSPTTFNGIDFYGTSWNEEIPEIQNNTSFNVLATHRMIIHEDKLWKGQEGHEKSQYILRHNKFDLIISGDNHNAFTDRYRSRWLFNCGTLIRNKIDQSDHIPHFFIFDTDSKKHIRVDIPVKPFDEIMDTEIVEEEKELKEKASDLVMKLRESYEVGVDFRKKVLNTTFKKLKNQRIRKYVLSAIGANDDEIKQFKNRTVKKKIVRRKRGN